MKDARTAAAGPGLVSKVAHASPTNGGILPPKAVKVSREEELLRNAIQLFSRGGFRETSLQEIADELGITRPLFYYYFESKEDLLWRIIGHLGDALLEQARPIAAGDETPIRRLVLLAERHLRTLLENVDAFRIYFAERHLLSGQRDQRLRRGERLYHQLITEVITEGQRLGEIRAGDAHLAAHLALGTANSLLRWYTPTGTMTPEELISATVAYMLAGMQATTE
jgi:TetR/AcrR family transcriptional regulator, cholesterol catabolism regulator